MYHITEYTRKQAKRLNVTVKPSSNPLKKIDVYKKGVLIASVGAIGYKDYPTYIKTNGLEYANKRRQLYRIRHSKDLKSGNGYWANKLLW